MDITTKNLLGKQVNFLPHGYVHHIDPDAYKNLLIAHNDYVNKLGVVKLQDVEMDPLKNILIGYTTKRCGAK